MLVQDHAVLAGMARSGCRRSGRVCRLLPVGPLSVNAESERVPAAGARRVGRQRLSGLDDAVPIGGADHDDMLPRSGVPGVAPRAPGDLGARLLELDRLPAGIIDVELDA